MMILTVVGSYPKVPNRPRPGRLRTALARLDRGEISPGELARVEDEVTIEVVREQEEAGVELLTDGQVRWLDEQTYVAGRLAGISLGGLARSFDTNTYFREPIVEREIAWRGPITLRDYEFAREHATRPVKPVLTGPYTLARLSRDESYGSLESLALAYAEALNQEAKALTQAGPPLIQFNEPAITKHPEDVALVQNVWRRLLDGIDAETAAYFYFGPPGGAVGAAVEAGFTTVGVDATIAGVLEALASGPRPAKLGAGVIDARTTRMESSEEIGGRIERALTLMDGDNLYVNPNQGLEFLPREQAQAKLVNLAEAVKRTRERRAR